VARNQVSAVGHWSTLSLKFCHKTSADTYFSGNLITPAGSRLVGRHALRSIFVNYRRNDSEGEAGRLFDDLTSRFSPEAVFMDVAGIEPGRDFRKVIDQSVATCSVLLALIGHEWLEVKDAAGNRRLDDPNDFVRIELASALRRDIPVIPVLVRGAKMPRSEQLPDELKDLAYRNALELSHTRWKTDVQVLLHALRPYMEEPDAQSPIVDRSARTDRPSIPDAFRSAPVVMGMTAAAHIVEGQILDHISRELAIYIGPIAEVIVKQAAKRCSSVEELCAKVASEIDGEPNRAKFLRACRSYM
jgi:TIR domain